MLLNKVGNIFQKFWLFNFVDASHLNITLGTKEKYMLINVDEERNIHLKKYNFFKEDLKVYRRKHIYMIAHLYCFGRVKIIRARFITLSKLFLTLS